MTAETITVLLSTSAKYATKQYSRAKDGGIKNRSYGSEMYFAVETGGVQGIAHLGAILECLLDEPFRFVIRGEPLPGINAQRSRRLLHADKNTGDPAVFRGQARHWFMVDVDHIPCPAAIDPVSDPEGAIEYVIGLLPPELHDATCFWQFSSSQGVFPGDATLSAHLWFWNAVPLDDAELTRWAVVENQVAGHKLIDPAVYRAVQAHYIAKPIFKNDLRDPLPKRYGMRQGLDDTVSLIIPTPKRKNAEEPSAGGYEPGLGVNAYLDEIGGPKGFRGPIVSAVASWISVNGSKANVEPLKALIRSSIARADPGGRPASDIERYASDRHLDEVIEWVRRRHGDQPPKDTGSQQDGQKSPLAALIDEFNEQYAVVNEAGKVLVYEQQKDTIIGRNVLIRITFPDFKRLYQNRLITVKTASDSSITKSAAEWWLNSPKRRQYLKGVIFDPTGRTPATYWNLWTGFAVEPTPGDWSLMRDHMLRVVCAGNDEHFEYLLNWIARMFQYPYLQGEVAVVVRGLKGVGKGICFQFLRKAWGQHGAYIANAKHLVGNFNAHLRDCVFLFADEAFFPGDRQHESVQKALITEPVLPIEAKHQNLVMVQNMLHIGMAANASWVIPASHDERRYFMLNATDQYRGNKQHFVAIAAQMDDGGLAGMIYEMLHRDISKFDVTDIPSTEALTEQKALSLDQLDSWWKTCLERGFVWRSRYGLTEFKDWPEEGFYTTELLNQSYLQWCADNRKSRPDSRELLGRRLTEIYGLPSRPTGENIIGERESATPGFLTYQVLIKKSNQRGYRVGTLEEARVQFSEMRGITGDWGLAP